VDGAGRQIDLEEALAKQRSQFLDKRVTLYGGDCLAVLAALPESSIDSVVCDPPYHLTSIVKRFGGKSAAPAKVGKTGAYARASAGFMGKQWDGGDIAFRPETWALVLRVLKPGGHLIAFSGTRTYHRMACAIEDAGFEVRDMIAWHYGSGFPKSHNVGKAIANRADPVKVREIKVWLAEQFEVSGQTKSAINKACGFTASDYLKTEPGNDAGGRATWHLLLPYGEKWLRLKEVLGFGDDYDAEIERYGVIVGQRVSLKENREIYGKYSGVVTDYELTDAAKQWDGWGTALKPATEPMCLARKPLDGTVAENVLKWGTGALNIDACRVNTEDNLNGGAYVAVGGRDVSNSLHAGTGMNVAGKTTGKQFEQPVGRWPANLMHDNSPEVVAMFPDSDGQQADISRTAPSAKTGNVYGKMNREGEPSANRRYAEEGSTNFAALPGQRRDDSGSAARFFWSSKAAADDRLGSKHPTVKPIDLMQELVRLVTPKGGTVLDPFAGTGTTGEAAWREGMRAILIEREEEYQADIARRMELAANPTKRAAVAKTKNRLERPDDLPLFQK
jgi:DNA modification methylase